MSPRPYRLGQRQAASDQTRIRVLSAARDLLMESSGISAFSIDAVARQADVARMTIYHQFGSKIGLLEALCDFLAEQGGMEKLASAFQLSDPLAALDGFITVFGQFWQSDRLVTRRLRGLAMLDPEFEQVIQSRDERRRKGVRVIVQRLTALYPELTSEKKSELVNILYTLTGFECCDTLAGSERTIEEIIPFICQLAHAALHL